MKRSLKYTTAFGILVASVCLLFSCSAVFEGGASGKVVDAESTETPKAGIQDVEVYVYTSEYMRNEDYRAFNGNGKFNPSSSSYIGHTTTSSDGTFSLGKLMWESDKPVFGKSGDSIPVFLLFYHENYGLQKNDNHAVILSDSVSYVVYQELTAIRSTTVFNISILDASQDPVTTTRLPPTVNQAVNVKITVPQTTTENQGASPLVKVNTITGTGNISVSYPRYSSGTTVNRPTISIQYGQSGDNINYKPCLYGTAENPDDYSFITDITTNPVTRANIQGGAYPIQIYMKPTVHTMPTISGQLCLGTPASGTTDEGSSDDDNVRVMLASVAENGTLGNLLDYTSATVMSAASGNGANGSRVIHGRFSGLGEGITWTDDTYNGKFSTKEVAVIFDLDGSGTISSGDRYYLLKDDDSVTPAINRALRSNETTRDIGRLVSTDLMTY